MAPQQNNKIDMGLSARTPSEGPAANPLEVFDNCEVRIITPQQFKQNQIPLPSGMDNSFLGRERKPGGRGPVY